MFLMVNLLMALSLGVQREQLEQRIGLTWPRPFLLRPLRKISLRQRRNTVVRYRVLRCSLLDHVGLILKSLSDKVKLSWSECLRTEDGEPRSQQGGLSLWCRYVQPCLRSQIECGRSEDAAPRLTRILSDVLAHQLLPDRLDYSPSWREDA